MSYIIYASKLRLDFVASLNPIVGEHFYIIYLMVPSWILRLRIVYSGHFHTCHRPAKLNTWSRFLDLSNVLFDFPYHVFFREFDWRRRSSLGQSNSQIRTILFYFLGILFSRHLRHQLRERLLFCWWMTSADLFI